MRDVIIQFAANKTLAPKASLLRNWAEAVLKKKNIEAEVTIRIVEKEEMSQLNANYRHKQGATNVLSFPFDMPDDIDIPTRILGDIVICADVVNEEARLAAPKDASQAVVLQYQEAHWAHMVIHGMLHLMGYDHTTDEDANIMEPLETEVMQSLGFADPYTAGEHIKYHD